MCFATPGKVIEIKGEEIVVDYKTEKRKVKINLIENLKIGEYVIMNNGVVINRLSKEDAEKSLEILKNARI